MADSVQPLIEGYQHIDPRLYDILKTLAAEQEALRKEIFPTQEQISSILLPEPLPLVPTSFTYSTTPRLLILKWTPGQGARAYDLRVGGTSWENSSQITVTLSTEVRLDPIKSGSTKYWLKSINGEGEYSTASTSVIVVINNPGTINITGRVIDNNVLLSWSVPSSTWEIDYYRIERDGIFVGNQKGTFAVIFESTSGTFVYSIIPVDLAGNLGPEVSISLVVAQPPDFELQDYRVSLLDQYKVNALIYGSPILGWSQDDDIGWNAEHLHATDWSWDAGNTGKLLVCIELAEQYQVHFTSEGWDQPSDQTGANFPIYIQPTALTAKYQEVINYGTVINSTILNIDYTLEQLVTTGVVNGSSTLEHSMDGVVWSTPASGKSLFIGEFQYVRVTVNFTATNTKALALFYNLSLSLDVKREVDSGSAIANAGDTGGTFVAFNKPFKDIDSITVTAESQEPLQCIFDFVDDPNPLGFKVFVFDSIGSRTTYLIAWKARGII
jgi:hypothetical protein